MAFALGDSRVKPKNDPGGLHGKSSSSVGYLKSTEPLIEVRHYRAPSRIPRTSGTYVRSARKGIRSVSSASCGSLNHEETGTALLGWKMYDAGELSRIMVSAIGRPSWDRSYPWRMVSKTKNLN